MPRRRCASPERSSGESRQVDSPGGCAVCDGRAYFSISSVEVIVDLLFFSGP